MSLPVSDLTVTASSGYDRATRILSQSWRGEELTYRSPELQSMNIGMSEDYTLSIDRARPLGRREGLLEITEVLKEAMMTMPSMLRELVESVEGSLKELVLNSLRELGAPVLNVEVRYGEGIGLYTLAILDCSARQALEYWLKIVDRVRDRDIPVFVVWTGSVDVTPEEMGAYIGTVLAKMNVFLATREPLDIVKILREEWGI